MSARPAIARNRARSSRCIRTGLTLVEMLVATAVTLLLVASLTQVFQIVGNNVTANRATIEMAGQLRGVGIRMQTDVDGVTIPVRPWPDPASGFGYFEYIEGWDHDGSPYLTGNTSFGDNDDVLMLTARSDDDPFLGLYTDRYNSANSPPTLIASPSTTTIHSNLAEVAWWTTLTDQPTTDTTGDGLADSGNGTIDPAQREDFTLYRRVLLIRPDLNEVEGSQQYVAKLPPPTSGNRNPTYDITQQTDLQRLYNALRTFYARNDLSVRIQRNLSGNNLQVLLVANSLEDLTQRQNRFAHSRIVAQAPAGGALRYTPRAFPDHVDRDATSATSLPLVRSPNPTSPFAEPGLIKSGVYQGEDVMLPHTTAFDVRAYDPMAIVGAYPGEDGNWGQAGADDDGASGVDDPGEAGWPGTDDEAVNPGDPGYALPGTIGSVRLVADPSTGTTLRTMQPIGRGAFVDLYYTVKRHHDANASASFSYGDYSYNANDGLTNSQNLPSPPHPSSTSSASETSPVSSGGRYYSHFSGAPQQLLGIWPNLSVGPRLLAVYDTWSFHYEVDGFDQDGVGGTDQGTDGFDTDGTNGVDDVGERETSPPYPVPLRGVQVRIRMIEHDMRQVRQVTVESDFTPE